MAAGEFIRTLLLTDSTILWKVKFIKNYEVNKVNIGLVFSH